MKKLPLILGMVPGLLWGQQTPASFTLPNGLQVQLFEDHSLPLVRGRLMVALPPPNQDGEAWLRPLGFRMLAAGGSGTRSAAAFALSSDALGLDLPLFQSSTSAIWTFATRTQDQESAFALLADRVTRPSFDPLALEPARLVAWTELSESDLLSRARLRFQRSLFGLPEPEERGLATVDIHTLSAWHHRLFRPDRTRLVLWGDLSPSQARQLAMLSLGAWSAQPAPAPVAAPEPAEVGPFFAILPGEAPSLSMGLASQGEDSALRRFLRPWVLAQLQAAGIRVSNEEPLTLQSDAILGTPIASLQARLSAALDLLPASFTARDLESLTAQTATERSLMGLHPGALLDEALEPMAAPESVGAARTVLERWCAPGNRRILASGDPGSLQSAQTETPKR